MFYTTSSLLSPTKNVVLKPPTTAGGHEPLKRVWQAEGYDRMHWIFSAEEEVPIGTHNK